MGRDSRSSDPVHAARALARVAVAIVGVSCATTSARLGAEASGGPSIIVPAHFAEGENRPKPAPSAESAGADAGPPPSRSAALPDPPPLVTATQWLFRFDYSKGKVTVASVVRKDFPRPVPTERHVGRFAVELWIGKELVDRVRFDFPLLAADPPPDGPRRPLRENPAFGPGAETSREVLVPASDRATRAVLVDRLDGHAVELPWPPEVTPKKTEAEPVPPSR